VFPGEIEVVNIFIRDPAYLGHVVCGTWLKPVF